MQGPSCGQIHILQALQRKGVAKDGREQNHNGVHAQALRLALQEDRGAQDEASARARIWHKDKHWKGVPPHEAHGSSKADDKGECIDRVNRNFSVDEPDRIWCSDFTYIWTDEGWAFLCVVIDLFSRKVVSWSLMKRHTCALVCEAFRKAFWRRGTLKGLTFHSDRGSEYSSSEFRRLLDSCSVVQSFPAPGCPYDNSVCESFFKYLKKEETDRYRYRTFEQLRASILGYIDGYYNSRRLHSSIGYMTPNEKDALFYGKR